MPRASIKNLSIEMDVDSSVRRIPFSQIPLLTVVSGSGPGEDL